MQTPSLHARPGFYSRSIRPLLFRMDAEKSHDFTIGLCEAVGKIPFSESIVRWLFAGHADPLLRTEALGLTLQSPVALGAGFDKNGRALSVLSALGFGAIEIGAVSMQPCPGNSGCRSVRLEGEEAVLTRYGVPNDGVEKILPRFARHRRTVPTGINVIWNSSLKPDSPVEDVVADIAAGIDSFSGCVDYATVNFACPNIRGESHFDDIANVRMMFEAIDATRPQMPVLLKFRHRDDALWIKNLVDLSRAYPWVKGFIPIAHAMRLMGPRAGAASAHFKGSISGAPLKDETISIVRRWFDAIDKERHLVVATGGITTAEDIFEAIAAGATFVQVYTAMVYRGPGLARRLNEGLLQLMQAAGMVSTAQLRGSRATTPAMPEAS